jgi:NAD-dependent dihydropyrimidine dehydrogenase PreA subunit
MIVGAKRDRGKIQVDINECKGCGLCIEACPPKVIAMSKGLNHYGYRTAMYAGSGCTGCGICFLACPEPGAITVSRLTAAVSNAAETSRIVGTEATACPGN